jgi:5-methylcytosine-specific restriction endonuclease McrA
MNGGGSLYGAGMDYQEYLKSREWEVKRQAVLMWWGYKCALCGSTEKIQVHHNTYARLEKELFTDLIPLCSDCHDRHHSLPYTSNPMRYLDWISKHIEEGIKD